MVVKENPDKQKTKKKETKIHLSIWQNVLLKLVNILKKDPVTLNLLFPACLLEVNVGLSAELPLTSMIFWLTNSLSVGSFLYTKSLVRPGKITCLKSGSHLPKKFFYLLQ